jgi:hypothetical protein
MNKEKQTAEGIEAILIKAMTSFDLSKQVFQIQQIINQQTSEMQKEIDENDKQIESLMQVIESCGQTKEALINKYTALKQSADALIKSMGSFPSISETIAIENYKKLI